VNADRAAAVRAVPTDLFVCHELPNSKLANGFQIFEHAHVVPGPISLIQLLQTRTGKLLTLKAKSWFCVLDVFTIFDPALGAIGGLMNIRASAAGTFVFFSQISQANAAVHSAGGN